MNDITDVRCPSCNQPIIGKEEVILEKPAKAPTCCPRCKTAVRLVPNQPG